MSTFFIVMIILTIVVVGGFSVLIAFVLNKASKGKNAKFLEEEKQEMKATTLKNKKKLISFPQKELYKQVSNAMTYEYSESVTHNKLSGRLYAPNKKPIAVFTKIQRDFYATGHIYVMTKSSEIYYEFSPKTVKITLNDAFLGELKKDGSISDADNTKIGTSKRPMESSSANQSFPLAFNGRNLAMINTSANYANISKEISLKTIFEELKLGTPILTLENTPTQEEEKWLLSLALFEVVFHGYKLVP